MGLLDNQTQAQYQASGNLGGYQYTSLKDIINNFLIAYVGENKLIGKVKRTDVAFYAQRALAELSYDTLRSKKSQEIEVPPSLKMMLPQDYVNYVKLTWVDGRGVERILYPAQHTSNPKAIVQGADGSYTLSNDELQYQAESDTWAAFKLNSPNELSNLDSDTDVLDSIHSGRFGLSPQQAQMNGSFFIDNVDGYIHFSSNINGKTVTLKYVSDNLGADGDQVVHKFAEEAMYKFIAYSIVSTSPTIQEHVVRRFKKEKFAATRQAKLRLSNIKLEEIAQVMRGKSKQIKH
jgi:hypothetical protein|tara:strand:- start:681 stop:1553 length:873 start_codon:yes stop_codon:yes gene_type:complete